MAKSNAGRVDCQAVTAERQAAISLSLDSFPAGAHFPLVRADSKRPAWRCWNRRRPAREHIAQAYANGMRIGVIPESIECAALDIDRGAHADIESLIASTGPVFSYETPSGGRHVLYRMPSESPGDGKFEFAGAATGAPVSGDIRTRGLLILYGWRIPELAAALHGGGGEFPRALLTMPAARARYNRVAGLKYETLGRPLETVQVGERHHALYAVIRQYGCREYGAGRMTTAAELLHFAMVRNEEFREPLPTAEVEKSVRGFWKWVTGREWIIPARPAAPKNPHAVADRRAAFIEIQAARGRRSGGARRKLAEPKIKQAQAMSAAGESVRAIAAAVGRHRTTVERWLSAGPAGHA